MAWALSACAPSVVIKPTDDTYAYAQSRLRRTGQTLASSAAAEDERAAFMQAESLYRYRFDLPPRSAVTYAAQIGAVVAELPALQALSGSLDLGELRLRTYDGAVQLWESLLLRAPQSSLRAFALYRLGWAYRNVGLSGLPREDGDEAFRELLTRAPVWPSRALVEQALATPWKSKDTAAAWSLLPGAGHLYVGEVASGITRLAVALASAAAILVPTVIGFQRRNELSWKHDWPLLASGSAGVIALSIDYTLSYQDAMRAVVEFNERHERAFEQAHPEAP